MWLAVWLAALAAPLGVGAYRQGDTVHMARRAQFKQVRSEWHEIFGRYCPHFGVDRLVAVPLPKPKTFEAGDDYKMSLALDHYNFHTSWLKLIDGKRPSSGLGFGLGFGAGDGQDTNVPMLEVDLVRAGEDVTAFRAKVVPLPAKYAAAHGETVEHFRNATHWPKLLLVKYTWQERHLVRVDRGLLVVTAIGVLVGAYLMIQILSGAGDKLSLFVEDVAYNYAGAGGDDSAGGFARGRPMGGDTLKGE